MDNTELYLLHSSGMLAMLNWIEQQHKLGTPIKLNNQTIYLHPLTSRFFSLGVSKNKKYAKLPFLAIQPNESLWMKLIQWEGIYIKDRDLHIYLVSKLIKGNGYDLPDIPAFAIAISLDTMDKINIIKTFKNIDGREYYQENSVKDLKNTQGQVFINFKSKILDSLNVKLLKQEEHYLKDVDFINYTDLLSKNESALQSKYSEGAPVFKGDENEAKSIFAGWLGKYEAEKEKWLGKSKNNGGKE